MATLAKMTAVLGIAFAAPLAADEAEWPLESRWVSIGRTENHPGFAIAPTADRMAIFIPEGTAKARFFDALTFSSWSTTPGRVVAEGEAGEHFGVVHSLQFSPDGKHLAYAAGSEVARSTDPDPGTMWVVLDGKKSEGYGIVTSLAFSPDSRHLAAVVGEGNELFIVVDGVPQEQRYRSISFLKFSPDNKQVAYSASTTDQSFVVVGDRRSRPYNGIGEAFFSPDGKRVAYLAGLGDKDVMVIDGADGPPYDRVHNPIFSPDSERVAYWAGRGKQDYVVVDGKEIGESNRVETSVNVWIPGPLVFSPDSKRVGFIARDRKDAVIVVGDASTRHANAYGFGLTLTANGDRTAYGLIRDHRIDVVVDGETHSTDIWAFGKSEMYLARSFYRLAGPQFSPDGRHVAYLKSVKPDCKRPWSYASAKGDTKCSGARSLALVVAGVATEPFDTIHDWRWTGDASLQAVVQRDDELLRLELHLTPRS